MGPSFALMWATIEHNALSLLQIVHKLGFELPLHLFLWTVLNEADHSRFFAEV